MNEGYLSDPRRKLPSVSSLLQDTRIQDLIDRFSRPVVVRAVKAAINEIRLDIASADTAVEEDSIINKICGRVKDNEEESLRPVINASGVVLHTNLGRAVLPETAVSALGRMGRYCNMEIELKTGLRGRRNHMTEFLLCELTGAEAAMLVNNNAAATFFILAALCRGKEVIISRSQLIEIGGSFRLPDCIAQSGAGIVEVGTTNRTHLRDYEEALSENTGAILKANTSNYRIVGFSKQVPVEDLASLKKEREFLLIDDLGCGAIVDTRQFNLPKEPSATDSIRSGSDLVCFSGDKLLGGAQAGIIIGKKHLIDRLKVHPLARILRVGKLTDVALERTLRLFLDPQKLKELHPAFRMLSTPASKLKEKASNLKKRFDRANLSIEVRVKKGEGAVGGGALPAVPIETYVLSVRSSLYSPDRLSFLLRRNRPPIIARISGEEVLLDMLTLLEGEEEEVFSALKRIGENPNL